MSSITKKQSSLALVVIVFATILIAGKILTSSSDNTVMAKKHKKGTHQKIEQSNHQSQKATCLTAGANSGISGSCNNTAAALNANGGGNGAASNGKGSGSDQKIGQSNHQKQKAVCLSAGANSPIITSCNNTAVSANANGGGNGAA
jgi:hypothetical protein